ncbi:MAG: right-handed parallel beta-helix repeat-containing protein [Chloroflexota bacterium]
MNQRANHKVSLAYFSGLVSVFALLLSSIFSIAYANGTVYYVDQSAFGSQSGTDWDNAFLTVQQALNVAVDGDEIWIAEGVYLPSERTDVSDARSVTFLLTEGVEMYGGFPSGGSDFSDRNWEINKTILSGDIDNNDTKTDGITESYDDIQGSNAHHVIQGSTTVTYTNTTVVDGFVITAGKTEGGSGDGGGKSTGAGINFKDNASPVLRNLYIIGTYSENDGGGIHFFSNSNPVLENVMIENTRANDFGAGVFFLDDNNPTFSNVSVIGTLGRHAAGVYLNDRNTADFGNFYVCRNTSYDGANSNSNAGSGLSIANDNNIQVMNAAFSANVSGENGGALRMRSNNSVDLDNVTMSGNQAANGGGIYVREAGNDVTISNSIIWGNSSEIDNSGLATLNATHSLISDNASPFSGTGNVASTTSPFVEDPDNGVDNVWGGDASRVSDDNCGNLRLKELASPVDAGLNTAVPVDVVDVNSNGNIVETLPIDLDGKVRIHNTTVDMGAYEISGDLLPQTITFELPAGAQDGMLVTEEVTLDASSTSGLDVTLTVETTSVCEIVTMILIVNQRGTCTITASQPGNNEYEPADDVQQSISVSKNDQNIMFTSPDDGDSFTIDDVVDLEANASSNLTVVFSSLTPSICSISDDSATLLQAGTCTIEVNQSGNDAYNAAPAQAVSLLVNKKSQSIDFISPNDEATGSIGDAFTLFATTDSGLSVSFAVTTPSVCSISNNLVTMLTNGSCQIKASQAGNENFQAAVDVFRSIVVGSSSLQAQSITFSSPANNSSVFVDTSFNLVATASSGLTVKFVSKTPSICSVSGNTASAVAIGTCQITARQTGNDQYNAASDVVHTVTVQEAGLFSVFIPLVIR